MSRDPYRRVAPIYDRIFGPLNQGLRKLGLRMFPPAPGMAILDIGCGTGIHLEMYLKYGCALHGIDLSPSMLGMARARLGEGADLRIFDAVGIPHPAGTFDLVICMLALHEMDEAVRGLVIAEVKRVLKGDGRILFIDFHAGSPRPIKGWLTKLGILIVEAAAGGRHFRNYRNFMSIGGLPTLIKDTQLTIDKELIIGGNTFALYLLRRD
ncbi:MAG: class I SAM-dependent methyltransferase [Smithellaceae bacterium]|nr:class I SAM-dependent methyltransferase [Smithellaceae bacterium]